MPAKEAKMHTQEQMSSAVAGPPSAATRTVEKPHRSVTRSEVARFRDVGLTFSARKQQTEALRGFDLTLTEGERMAVVGPSGCGKSSLLALTAGLLRPTTGEVSVDQAVALMPQRDLLVPWRSALRNAALALEAQGVSRVVAAERARPLFERFGLAGFEQAHTWELSGGMRQRVAFLRTILTGRPLLALDEPFGALDAITRGEMHEWLEQALAAEPRTLLLVTHDIEEALTLAGRVVLVSPRPGRVAGELIVDRPEGMPRRDWTTSPEFSRLKADALAVLG
jgi:ABC-type nitrate/sulfonate/bicarbonate transport system ATPase subunit